jgi:hypothetical protein
MILSCLADAYRIVTGAFLCRDTPLMSIDLPKLIIDREIISHA